MERPLKIALIVQARMGSTRLPGKVLKKVKEKELLCYLLERLKRVHLAEELIVATTTNTEDDAIVALCSREKVKVLRGPEEDVLLRYLQAAENVKANVIVRITGDCPLIDPQVIDKAIATFLISDVDYVSNTQKRTFPRGMDVEVFSRSILSQLNRLAKTHEEREHVTPYLYRMGSPYELKSFCYFKDASNYRLCVDTEEDFKLISKLLEYLPENFSLEDILEIFRKYPDFVLINQKVQQKELKNET